MIKFVNYLAAVTVLATSSVTAIAAGKSCGDHAGMAVGRSTHNFTGPYVGGNFGYGYGSGKSVVSFTANKSSYPNNLGIRGTRGGLHVGYGKLFANKVYLGVEGSADYSNSFTKGKGPDLNDIKSKRQDAYGLALRAGGILGSSMLTYAKAGLETAKWKTNTTYSLDGGRIKTNSQNRRATGTVLGLGMETLVTKNIMLGGECAYTIYKQAVYLSTINPINKTQSQVYNYKPRTADFRLRASYKW